MRKDSREADAEASENGAELLRYISSFYWLSLAGMPFFESNCRFILSFDGVSTCLSYI